MSPLALPHVKAINFQCPNRSRFEEAEQIRYVALSSVNVNQSMCASLRNQSPF